MSQPQISNMLLGALVADAASLGLHWLYDADRIAEITRRQDGQCAFTPIDAANFEGVAGYFAHGEREDGALTQYGEVLRLTIQSMNITGQFSVTEYQAAFAGHFGPGGTYHGYIDRPTRGALENIANEQNPSGIDDDQNPAVSRLPAIVGRYHKATNLHEVIADSMHVTNVNDVALSYSLALADAVSRVLSGESVQDALHAAAQSADASIKPDLVNALSTEETDSTEFAGLVGRACHLPTSGPVMFHILKHANSYRDAIDRNILAGGDSAGRAICIGAIMGCAHGVEEPTGIPLDWVLKMKDARDIWDDCRRFENQGK